MAYKMTPLQAKLANPSLSLCPDGKSCPLYSGNAPRHAVALHKAPEAQSTEIATYAGTTAVQVREAVNSAPFRTIRLGAVSIREVKVGNVVTGYSVRAPLTARWSHSAGKYICGPRETRIYQDYAGVAVVVAQQCHGKPAIAGRSSRVLASKRSPRALRSGHKH